MATVQVPASGSPRPNSASELSQVQLEQIAGKIQPDEWGELGARLGFDHTHLQRIKRENKRDIKAGIRTMLISWLEMHNVTKLEARQFLARKLNEMGRKDLYHELLNTEICFVAPTRVSGKECVEFEYHVGTFYQETKEISINCVLSSEHGPISAAIIHGVHRSPDFAGKLCAWIHLLGLRLAKIHNIEGGLRFTLMAFDVDGVNSLGRTLTDPDQFIAHLREAIEDQLRIHDVSILLYTENEDLQAANKFFKQQEAGFNSTTPPAKVSDVELVTLAKHIDSKHIELLGMVLGNDVSAIQRTRVDEGSERGTIENLLFNWKQTLHPYAANRAALSSKLVSIGLQSLADKIDRGTYREDAIEENRRVYLKRFSTCGKRGYIKHFCHPKPPPPEGEEGEKQRRYVNYPPDKVKTHQQESAQPSPLGQCRELVTLLQCPPRPSEPPPPAVRIHGDNWHQDIPPLRSGEQFNAPNIWGADQPGDTYVHPTGESETDYDPNYERIIHKDVDHHHYENDVRLRTKGQPSTTKRTSFKKSGSSSIPALYELDLSVLAGLNLWDQLMVQGVTKETVKTIPGLAELAIVLDTLKHDIADIIWAALMKDQVQHFYLRSFITANIEIKARVITNRQEVDIDAITSIEGILARSKDRKDFPTRIFIEAGMEDDRYLLVQKIGHDWANEKDANTPLGNIDLVFVLRLEDIDKGSTVGDAIVKQFLSSESGCQVDFRLNAQRVGEYLTNTSTEFLIVLNGTNDAFGRHMNARNPEARGFRELILGEYLANCIVVMTTAPEITGNKNFAHYKIQTSTSLC